MTGADRAEIFDLYRCAEGPRGEGWRPHHARVNYGGAWDVRTVNLFLAERDDEDAGEVFVVRLNREALS